MQLWILAIYTSTSHWPTLNTDVLSLGLDQTERGSVLEGLDLYVLSLRDAAGT